jgi:large subunit ribosomal protein L21
MNSQPLQSQSSSTHPDLPLSATPRAQDAQPKTHNGIKPSNNFDETTMTPRTRADVPIAKQPVEPTFTTPLKVTKTLMSQLPHLAGQKPHYVVAQLHARPYLLTEGDHLRLPFLMPNVKAGDIVRFNRASAVGSRDFTMKGAPTIDERMYECRMRVTGVDAEPLRIKEKTKRRNRHVKQAKSKHRYTLMRVMDVRVKTPEELLAEGAVVVEDGEGEDGSVIGPRS